MTDVRAAEVEEAIKTCVREFYGKARQDPLLGPISVSYTHLTLPTTPYV